MRVLRRDRRFELRRRDLVGLVGAGIRHDRHAIRQQRHVGVRNPVRRGNHDFIAWVKHRHEQVVDGLFRAHRDEDLRSRVFQRVVALEFRDDRVLQFRNAFDGRVAREAVLDRGNAGFGDVRRRIEVGFTDAQADDVVPLGLQSGHAARQGNGGGGFDALDAVGEYDGHGYFPGLAKRRGILG